ncbi:transketolase, partial [Francisella tularensis subsp. holarctica]|nr:transketolase [Francisella tularensis subsp. holarctica]
CSLAGTLGLNKLVAFWDDNNISIDVDTKGWFSDNTPEIFRAYGWHVIENVDGHDFVAIEKAINEAHSQQQKPTLIC